MVMIDVRPGGFLRVELLGHPENLLVTGQILDDPIAGFKCSQHDQAGRQDALAFSRLEGIGGQNESRQVGEQLDDSEQGIMRIDAQSRPVRGPRSEASLNVKEQTVRREPGYDFPRHGNCLDQHETQKRKHPKWNWKVYFPLAGLSDQHHRG